MIFKTFILKNLIIQKTWKSSAMNSYKPSISFQQFCQIYTPCFVESFESVSQAF